jgi:hypothetical protein
MSTVRFFRSAWRIPSSQNTFALWIVTSQATTSASISNENMSSRILPGSTISPVVDPCRAQAVSAGSMSWLCRCSKSNGLPSRIALEVERSNDKCARHSCPSFDARDKRR